MLTAVGVLNSAGVYGAGNYGQVIYGGDPFTGASANFTSSPSMGASGGLSASAVSSRVVGSPALGGTGVLSAHASSISIPGGAALSGSGHLTTASLVGPSISRALSASGTLIVSVGPLGVGSSPTLSAVGLLSLTSSQANVSSAVSLGGAGRLNSFTSSSGSSFPDFTSLGALSALVSPGVPAAVTFAALGTLGQSARVQILQPVLSFAATGTLSVVGRNTASTTVTLFALASLTTAPTTGQRAGGTLSALGLLSTLGIVPVIQLVDFSVVGVTLSPFVAFSDVAGPVAGILIESSEIVATARSSAVAAQTRSRSLFAKVG